MQLSVLKSISHRSQAAVINQCCMYKSVAEEARPDSAIWVRICNSQNIIIAEALAPESLQAITLKSHITSRA